MSLSPWMTRKEVAALLSLSVATLAYWAQKGGGPPYYKLGKDVLRYDRTEVEAWIAQGKRLHTADDGTASAQRAARRVAARRSA